MHMLEEVISEGISSDL